MPDSYSLLPRGVYQAPVLSPDHETILYAVDSHHCLLKDPQCIYVGPGDNPLDAMDRLWEQLEAQDPTDPTGTVTLPAAS